MKSRSDASAEDVKEAEELLQEISANKLDAYKERE